MDKVVQKNAANAKESSSASDNEKYSISRAVSGGGDVLRTRL
jgi:hypothetical protein